MNVTVPVAVPEPGLLTCAVAVNTTFWPKTEGLTEEAIVQAGGILANILGNRALAIRETRPGGGELRDDRVRAFRKSRRAESRVAAGVDRDRGKHRRAIHELDASGRRAAPGAAGATIAVERHRLAEDRRRLRSAHRRGRRGERSQSA